MKFKVLVTGASGQLGFDVCEELERRGMEYCGVSTRDFDITDQEAAFAFIKKYRPDAVIHCAAYTAVEKAEEEQELCRRVNVDGTRNIALACKEIDAKMLYVSTDYVFSGEGDDPHQVDEPTNPLNVYGKTKLGGELTVRQILQKYFIVRTSWVFGKHGNNFVRTMLRLGKEKEEINVVCNQIGSPTYTADLARLLCDMIMSEKYGLYHAANEGFCSWAEFAEEIFRQAGLPAKVNYVLASAYPSKVIRPQNSRLDTRCLTEAGFKNLMCFKDALKIFLK